MRFTSLKGAYPLSGCPGRTLGCQVQFHSKGNHYSYFLPHKIFRFGFLLFLLLKLFSYLRYLLIITSKYMLSCHLKWKLLQSLNNNVHVLFVDVKKLYNLIFCLRSKAFNLNLSRISSLHKGGFLGKCRHYTFEREPA
jgi:hypothetical protein